MDSEPIFSEIDLRLSTVKRWGILHTIRHQSVAEHCFNVALIAERIAQQWFEINSAHDLYLIQRRALVHDHPEALSGDVPTIVKDLFNEDALEVRYSDLIPTDMYLDARGHKIVKIADRLDAIIFLRMEESMGNKTVYDVRQSIEVSLIKLLNTFATNELDHDEPNRLKAKASNFLRELFPSSQFFAQAYDRRDR